jgi:hypothetical protein
MKRKKLQSPLPSPKRKKKAEEKESPKNVLSLFRRHAKLGRQGLSSPKTGQLALEEVYFVSLVFSFCTACAGAVFVISLDFRKLL